MKIIFLVIMVSLIGCTTANKIFDENGEEALLIECGAAVSFSVCHDRAREECPSGYKTLSENAGFNRKEIRIRCNTSN